jgi:two-component system chemotaxis response regulator CheB
MMDTKFRVIMATTSPDLVFAIKSGLNQKPGIEMIINVNKPSEVENKLNRSIFNVLVIDMDTVQANMFSIRSIISRYKVLAIFTACAANRAQLIDKNTNTDFIIKPVSMSAMAGHQLVSAIHRRIEGYFQQLTPPDMRTLSKLVTGEQSSRKIIAVASSTGGTVAFEKFLSGLPADMPPLVIVQHMPSGFTKLMAERLNATFKQEVMEAQTGDFLQTGRVLMAPAGRHMKLIRQQGKLAVECFLGTKIHGVMPAADILFESVAELVKANAVGVILTGMGADGAKGLLQMHHVGASTVGQNQATCVVYGMPKVAKDLGAVDYELPLENIAAKVMSLV